MLTDEQVIWASEGETATSWGRWGATRTEENYCYLILYLIFMYKKNYWNGLKFDDVYSKNILPKIKDGTYEINLDEYDSIGTHWIDLYTNDNNVIYFDSFGSWLHSKRKKCKNS